MKFVWIECTTGIEAIRLSGYFAVSQIMSVHPGASDRCFVYFLDGSRVNAEISAAKLIDLIEGRCDD